MLSRAIKIKSSTKKVQFILSQANLVLHNLNWRDGQGCQLEICGTSSLEDPGQYLLTVLFRAIYTRRVARQYNICWLKKELSMVHGAIHTFFLRIELFCLSR